MKENLETDLADTEQPRPGESFLGRFHRLKTEARRQEPTPTDSPPAAETATAVADADAEPPPPPPPPADEDMPPLDTLEFESDYTGFLSPKVSETLRKAALRKLFHADEFNVVDGLDEYAEDYTKFEALGDIITADMRHQLEVAAQREAEKLKEQLLEADGAETPPDGSESTEDTTPPQTTASDTEQDTEAVAGESPEPVTQDPMNQAKQHDRD